MQKNFQAALLVLLLAGAARADVTLPRVFGDNMVLQRGQPVPVWGWAKPGEKVTVKFTGQTRTTRANADGKWLVRLAPLKTSTTPADLTVEAGEKITFTNVLVGEVWFCSGQSNMEKPLGEQRGQKPVINAAQELATGDDYPLIRIFRQMDHVATNTPQRDVNGSWSVCSSNALEMTKFSAAGYFFGREIFNALTNVPVGLVESAWGGTRIEPWTPREGFRSVPSLAGLSKINLPSGKLTNTTPVALFNGMIAPLAPFAIRGALWYQGESNCIGQPDGLAYLDKMRALINGWRQIWAQDDFPFYFVQIAPFRYHSDPKTVRAPSVESLPEIWEAQTAALQIKNTGMIVTTDITDDVKDIHPRNKLDVGKRLALVALAKTYGRNVEFSGPLFRSATFRSGRALIYFDHAEGLRSRDGRPLDWFTIAGADGIFGPARATVEDGHLVVSSPDVKDPVAVRFAWHELAQPNLVNAAGLPAPAFRTDGPLR